MVLQKLELIVFPNMNISGVVFWEATLTLIKERQFKNAKLFVMAWKIVEELNIMSSKRALLKSIPNGKKEIVLLNL
jgi:hypothetical protein